jgi:phosphoenolpyruvate-protein kinase (PTS system EI component)
VQGIGFVPGQARGVLRHGRAGSPGDILMLRAVELRGFTGQPAGVVAVDAPLFGHSMLRLLGRGIPTVAISEAQAAQLTDGTPVLLDGASGRVGASTEALAAPPPRPAVASPVTSADGALVELRASVRDAQGAAAAVANGAAAIGLVRSEQLAPADGVTPDAGFYTQALYALCEAAKPLTVTVRLLDVAPDKRPAWLAAALSAVPFGMQGARVFAWPSVRSVLDAQIEALAQLARHWDLRVLVPYVTDLAEFERWRAQLRRRLPPAVQIGAMAETPAAALAVGEWLAAADFVAIGCNDLMQCLFGADRDAAPLRRYLDPYAPVLYRFLRGVAAAAGAGIARVQVCGLLPQLPGVLPVLLGLGFRNLSVDPVTVPYLAQIVAATRVSTAAALADAVCAAQRSSEVSTMLEVPAWSASAQRGDSDG